MQKPYKVETADSGPWHCTFFTRWSLLAGMVHSAACQTALLPGPVHRDALQLHCQPKAPAVRLAAAFSCSWFFGVASASASACLANLRSELPACFLIFFSKESPRGPGLLWGSALRRLRLLLEGLGGLCLFCDTERFLPGLVKRPVYKARLPLQSLLLLFAFLLSFALPLPLALPFPFLPLSLASLSSAAQGRVASKFRHGRTPAFRRLPGQTVRCLRTKNGGTAGLLRTKTMCGLHVAP